MRFSSPPAAAAALGLLGTFISTAGAVSVPDGTTTVAADESVVPGAYIVEFDEGEETDSFYRGLRADGIETEHRMDLNYKLFRGASFHLRNLTDHEATAQSIVSTKSRVKNIWPVRKLSFPKPMLASVGGVNSGAAAAAAMPATATRKRQQHGADDFVPHVMTQVDKLLAEGYTGAGIRIGIVDTGVDYLHPALGGCFGPGCLVAYGYDFNGDNATSPTPVPDPDPYDGCFGHGTHVAGIIAAQQNPQGFTGAAPGVTLGMYKTSGCGGDTSNDMLIAGFNAAFEDGSDIISCSAGDDSGWASDPWAIAASRIAEAGVPVIVAPGNSGDDGLWYPSTPAAGVHVTAAGSVDSLLSPIIMSGGTYVVGGGDEDEAEGSFGLSFGQPSYQENVTRPLWAVSYNTSAIDDACTALPNDTPDLSDKVVLVRMPTLNPNCTPEIQADNIAAKGGEFLLYYGQTNENALIMYIQTPGIKGVAGIIPEHGEKFVELLSKGDNVTVTVLDYESIGIYVQNWENHVSPGYTSKFTSWGPTWEVNVKPQFTAPGGSILSTYPRALGSYAVLSGTSMATPFISAVFALLGEARGTLDPTTLRNVIASTSKPLTWHDGTTAFPGLIAPVPQQGAGMVQAYDAAHTKSVLSISSMSFNDSDHFAAKRTFSIQNTGSEDLTYALGHQKAVTMYSLSPNGGVIGKAPFPNPIVEDWAELSFESDEVVVPAGGSAEVTVTLTPPANVNATLLPVYSGYITLNGTTESISLPYLGVAGSLHDTRTIQAGYDGGVYLTNTDGHFNIPTAANTTFSIPRPDGAGGNAIWPVLKASLTVGTPYMRADVVAVGDSGNATQLPTTDFFGVKSLGLLATFPREFVYRGGARVYFSGALSDGTVVPAGSYKFVVSALRISGNPDEEKDWDFVETVPFNIEYTD